MTVDAKIRVKGGPKVYKRGPGLTGRPRLEQRLRGVLIAVHRFARTTPSPAEALWAAQVVAVLSEVVHLP